MKELGRVYLPAILIERVMIVVKTIAIPQPHQTSDNVNFIHIWTFLLGFIWVSLAGIHVLFAGQQVVPLSASFTDISVTSEVEPQQVISEVSELDEQRLIRSLLRTDFKVIYDDLPKIDGWRRVRMRVTGYCACPKCCGSYSDGVTASNHTIAPGDAFVAADKSYAFGTEMIIPGYHESLPIKVLDRGGAIKGDHLDAFFHSHEQALQWGVQNLEVLVKVN